MATYFIVAENTGDFEEGTLQAGGGSDYEDIINNPVNLFAFTVAAIRLQNESTAAQAFLAYDTSEIPANEFITSLEYFISPSTVSHTSTGESILVYGYNWQEPVSSDSTGNWLTQSEISNLELWGSHPIDNLDTSGSQLFPNIEEAFLQGINKTGLTKVTLLHSLMETATSSTSVEENISIDHTGGDFSGLDIETNPAVSTTDTLILTLNNLSNLVNVFSSMDALNIDLQYLTELASTLLSTDNIQIVLQDNTTIGVSLEQTETLLLTLNILQNLYKEFEDTDTLTLTLLTAVSNFADTTSSSNITLTLESIEDLLNIFSSTTQIELQTQDNTTIKAQLADTTNLLLQTTEATNILSLIQKQDNLITLINTTASNFSEGTGTDSIILTLEEASNLLSLLAESDNILVKIEKDENFNKFNFTWTDIDDSANQEWREVRTNDIIED